ncbi:hypothetical protein [Burkholderia sp. S-53]|uniref:hypothetical protein n=1 Tax=Burkholderia sp. S-53 TaxID=2906514 RepID=UPI0021D05151|nr:hypothetical protein [Burkholderia sp. S-53]UXU89743.1 hypothetical protein LXM88_30835 [Burkholderia sp. S-53]
MNSQTRSLSLPGIAALIAALVIAAPFLYGLHVQSTMAPLSADMLSVQLTSFIASLVYRTGVVFLIVRWHGEHRDQLAFRRPALLLTVYALCLLAWQVAQIFIIQSVVRSLANDGARLTVIVTLIAPLSAALYAFVAWFAWWFVTRMFRNDAIPVAPRGHAARRIAGLAAWLFASVLLLFMTQAVTMLLDYYDDDLKLVMLNYLGAVAIPAALAFAGAMLGLPRDLARLHGWRLLGASLVAMASIALLAYGALHLLGNVFGSVSLLSGMLTIVVLAGICVAYWVWFRVFYAPVDRDTAETSQGMQSS